jgi:hypothetical protein
MSEPEPYERELSVPSRTLYRVVEGLGAVPSAEREQLDPHSGTVYANVSKHEEDEWSDENMRRWEEADKLDPVLAEWLEAQRGE